MRMIQRLFTNNIVKGKKPTTIKKIQMIKIPPSFYKIPYDEQYESRDFIRVDNDKGECNKGKGKK